MNEPYVKKYDEKGLLLNPIVKNYLHVSNNRKTRREGKQKSRFIGNGKNFPLAVYGRFKYKKVLQLLEGKKIEHYILTK